MFGFNWKQLWKDTHGQDMIEYALLASFLVFATVAVVPDVLGKVSQIMDGAYNSMCSAGGTCGGPVDNNNDNRDNDHDHH